MHLVFTRGPTTKRPIKRPAHVSPLRRQLPTFPHSRFPFPSPILTPRSNSISSPEPRPSDRSPVREMDALFDTINVRDLLSAGDLSDPTSPLSAPDLRLLIQKLDSHSRGIKSQVQSYLLSHHSDFSSLFSLCSDAVSRTDDVASELGGVLQLISDHPIDVQIGEAVSEIEVKTREAKLTKELLELVRVISGLSERFGGAREALRSGRLRFAAEEIRKLKLAARVCDAEEKIAGREPVVYGLLKAQWHECFEEVKFFPTFFPILIQDRSIRDWPELLKLWFCFVEKLLIGDLLSS